MFKNLSKAIFDEGLTIEELSSILGIHRNTLTNKINGESEFSLSEAEKIQCVFRKYDFKYLFARDQFVLQDIKDTA